LFILVQNRTEPKMLSPTPNPPTLQKKLGLVALRDHRSWVWLGSRTQYLCIVNIKNISICIKNIVSLIIINIVNIKNNNNNIIIIILINSIDIKNIIICLINIIIFIINNIINKIIYKFEKNIINMKKKHRINLEGKIKNYYYYHYYH
jgi:hypothetical protein